MNTNSVNSVVAKLTQLRISMTQEERAILDAVVTGRKIALGVSQEDEVSAHALKDAVQPRINVGFDDTALAYKVID